MNLHEIFLVVALVLAVLASLQYWPRSTPSPYTWLGGLFPLSFAFFLASLLLVH
jgi:hypothetical protein